MDEVQLSQGCRATTRRQITLTITQKNIVMPSFAKPKKYVALVRWCRAMIYYRSHIPVNIRFDGFQAGICLLKVNNRNTRTRCEICSKLTIKAPGVFIVDFE